MDKSITDAQGNDEKMQTQGTEAAVNGTTQDQVAYYVQRREGHSGPHTVSALRDLLATGEIWENSLVWREGMSKWEPYAQVFHVTPTPPHYSRLRGKTIRIKGLMPKVISPLTLCQTLSSSTM